MAIAPDTPPIKLLIIEAQPIMHDALMKLFEGEADITVVEISATVSEAIPSLASRKPNLILYNLVVPKLELYTTLQRFQTYTVPTVMYGIHTDLGYVDFALLHGIKGYLSSSNDFETLCEMIRTVGHQQPYLNAEMSAAYQRAQLKNSILLSNREHEVLKLLAEGMSNQEIANQMGISISTVKKHVSSILDAFGTENRTKAVAIALRNHIIN